MIRKIGMNGTVRCAVIGIGVMGKKYALMLNAGEIDGLSLSAVCCRSAENVRWAEENLSSNVLICRDEDELYQHSDRFDAVFIVTPHKLHPSMTIRALNAGKHVMCDKPAGVTAADALAMNAAAEKSGKVYAMMCHQRTYARHRKIKALLDAGTIGQVTRISLENTHFFRTGAYHHSGSWRSSWHGEGGGALINQGYHLLDLWQYLFGLPQSVYAEIPFGKYNSFDVDDEAALVMVYPGKMTGTFILSTGEGSDTERFEIVGTNGRILLENNRMTITQFSSDTREYIRKSDASSRQRLYQTEEILQFGEADDAYRTMLHNFSAAVLAGEPLIAPGKEGVSTLELINAAYLSAWQGQRVTLPVDQARYLALLQEKAAAEGSD